MKKSILVLIAAGLCLISSNAFAEGIDAYTVLLLHGNGSDGSTTFLDDSPSNHPVTANGNAQVDAAYKKFGTGSISFDGTGDYLTTPDHNDWNIATSTYYTIDCWVKAGGTGFDVNYNTTIAHSDDTSNYWALDVYAQQLRFTIVVAGIVKVSLSDVAGQITDTNWHHIAIVKDNATYRMFLDGVQVAISTSTSTFASTGTLKIGSLAGAESFFNGWIDEVRISKGIARWTSDFTPPTEEYGAIPNDSPIANAGPDLIANAGEEVTLDGSYSNDPDGNIVSWVWRSLSDPQAPIVAEGEIAAMTTHGYVEELIELTVTDNNGATATDTMKITNTIVEDAQEIPQLQNEITQLQNQLETQQGVIDQLKQFPALENWMNR